MAIFTIWFQSDRLYKLIWDPKSVVTDWLTHLKIDQLINKSVNQSVSNLIDVIYRNLSINISVPLHVRFV